MSQTALLDRTQPIPQEVEERLDEIERVLKFDPYHPYRQELVREYLALTNPKKELAA